VCTTTPTPPLINVFPYIALLFVVSVSINPVCTTTPTPPLINVFPYIALLFVLCL